MSLRFNKKLRKPLRIALSVLLCFLFTGLLVAASKHQQLQPIKGFNLQITNRGRKDVLERSNLKKWILSNPKIDVKGKLRSGVDLRRIEKQTLANPWVADAKVYIDNNNLLQIEVTERKPVARIFELNGGTFYMDSSLAEMPVIHGNNYSEPVFTNVFFVKNDSLNQALKAKIAFMADLIGKSSFWNAQIEQIVVNGDQTFNLIPLLGTNQKILFGDTCRANEKLLDLFAFYKSIMPKIGWNSYRILDLRYSGQIVAEPSLGIKLPKPQDPLAKENKEYN